MKAVGKFILLELNEFPGWLNAQVVTRKIKLIQQHHTWLPAYKDFKGDNHFLLCRNMEDCHVKNNGFAEIAQNFTTFPDGKIMVCRNIDKIPAGIKGANAYGICLEHLGNFDLKKDEMTEAHRKTIISMTGTLLDRFLLQANDQTVVYHHWYDLITSKRIAIEGKGTTKSCPGTGFFGGNTVADFNKNFLPLLR